MSAITGVVNFNKEIVEAENIMNMLKRLEHRGTDHVGTWVQGNAGFGQRLLWTTPESIYEKPPIIVPAKALVAVADARLDNRDELINALQLKSQRREEITDSQLIVLAYEKWGKDCPSKLIGDFSFAIWNMTDQTLFCARDHMGIRPFYYYYQNRQFAFSPEIKALFALPFVKLSINEDKIAGLLLHSLHEKTDTFFQDINRLPPAHALLLNNQGINIWQYWSLDPTRTLPHRSDREYADEFKTIFTQAVECRLRSAFPVGSQLSGGLDSSFVTAIARDVYANKGKPPLQVFSAVFPSVPISDESYYINLVLEQGGLSPHFLNADQYSPLSNSSRMLWHLEEPTLAPNEFIMWLLLEMAQSEGIRVLLTGLDGDTTVSHGFGRLTELALNDQWDELHQEMVELDKFYTNYGSIRNPMISMYVYPALDKLAHERRWSQVINGVNQLHAYFRQSRQKLIKRYLIKPLIGWKQDIEKHLASQLDPVANKAFINTFRRETLEALSNNLATHAYSAKEVHLKGLNSGLVTLALEMMDKSSAAFGVEQRYPFFDIRLVEFCLALPAKQKLYEGWTRVVMRRAMQGILPVEVQWRRGKSNLGTNFSTSLIRYESENLADLFSQEKPIPVERYIDLDKASNQFARESVKPTDKGSLSLWTTINLNNWLGGIASLENQGTDNQRREI
jgi:asparagine synthase (glutamine-hydrolysing)